MAIYLILQVFAAGYSEYATVYPQPDVDWGALPFLVLVLLLSRALTRELQGYDNALNSSNTALRQENERRAQVEARLHHLAYHDVTSKFPNRSALTDWLDTARANDPRLHGALIVINPDRFGAINYALGHRMGDLLIR